MRRYSIICVFLICLAIAESTLIALKTRGNVHPDELNHLDAFCYYEKHWWFPPTDASGLRYGPIGGARVFNPEIVYWLYGRIGSAIKPIASRIAEKFAPRIRKPGYYKNRIRMYLPMIASGSYCRTIYQIYRLQNTILFLITLSILFWAGYKHKWAFVMGIGLLCIPQVIYVYSYANSDAWGLSFNFFLTAYALVEPQPFSSMKKTVILSLLVGAVLLSKENYWLSIIISGSLIGYNAFKAKDNIRLPVRSRNIAVFLGLVLILITPMYIIYPLSQNINPLTRIGQLGRVNENKAAIGFRVDNPTEPGFLLKGKGVSFFQIWINSRWIELSLKSFYGVFGYMTTFSPRLAYQIALALALTNIFLTIFISIKHQSLLPGLIKLMLVLSPLVIVMAVLLSAYNSWTVDLQPQGRYLFPALTGFSFLAAGTIDIENTKVRLIRATSAVILFSLSIYVLWVCVITNPGLVF